MSIFIPLSHVECLVELSNMNAINNLFFILQMDISIRIRTDVTVILVIKSEVMNHISKEGSLQKIVLCHSVGVNSR